MSKEKYGTVYYDADSQTFFVEELDSEKWKSHFSKHPNEEKKVINNNLSKSLSSFYWPIDYEKPKRTINQIDIEDLKYDRIDGLKTNGEISSLRYKTHHYQVVDLDNKNEALKKKTKEISDMIWNQAIERDSNIKNLDRNTVDYIELSSDNVEWIKDLRAENAMLRAENAMLRAEIAKQAEEIAMLRAEIKAKDRQLSEKDDALAKKEEVIIYCHKEIKILTEKNNQLEKERLEYINKMSKDVEFAKEVKRESTKIIKFDNQLKSTDVNMKKENNRGR